MPAGRPEGLCPACLFRRLLSTTPGPADFGRALLPGERISRYEVIDELGRGGMGVVYRARDTELRRLVALKVLRPGSTEHSEWRRRLLQEARSASALNHPNIITIYEIASVDGLEFISMEFVHGVTLDKLIPASGMDLGDALCCAVQVADALSAAHAAGIVHRDVKPSNVIVDAQLRVKILDFGLAKVVRAVSGTTGTEPESQTGLTAEGSVLGSAPYMSPEQAEGRAVDSRSDIFSFGAVLYEMITGQQAFRAKSRLGVLLAVLECEPLPARQARSDVPQAVEQVITSCLHKNANERVQNMADVKHALEEVRNEARTEELNRKAALTQLFQILCGKGPSGGG